MTTKFIILIGLLLISCSTEPTEDFNEFDSCSELSLVKYMTIIENPLITDVYNQVNLFRLEHGLEELTIDYGCALKLAADHTDYMIQQNELSHDNYNQRTTKMYEIGAVKIGENVARGYSTAAQLLNAWSKSPGHASVLLGEYNRIAIAAIPNFRGTYYFTLIVYL